jgi:hypothetical protein
LTVLRFSACPARAKDRVLCEASIWVADEGPAKMKIRLTDGALFETSGAYYVESREDGYYLVDNGLLIPVDTPAEGVRLILELEQAHEAAARLVEDV